MTQRHGFSLLEVLVALAIISLSVLALLGLQTQQLRGISGLETRLMAEIVAENQLVETMILRQAPRIGVTRGQEEMGDLRFEWERQVAQATDTGVVRIDVRVQEAGEETLLVELSAFRGQL